MGLGNTRGNLTFVNISKGVFVVGKKGEQKTFTDLTGQLTAIDVAEDEYQGKKFEVLLLTITDQDGNYRLKLRFESGYARCVLNTLESADLTSAIMFAPKWEQPDAAKPGKGSMFVMQHGKAIKHRYTQKDPGDMPPLISREWKGKIEYDNTEQMRYYRDTVIPAIRESLVPAILAGPASDMNREAATTTGPSYSSPTDANHITEPIDDLPF